MLQAVRELDRIIRGEATRPSALRRGTIEIPIVGLAAVIVVLAMLYGLCMGCFALFKGGGPSYLQVLASMLKVPVLFLLTLAITFPSLYVFNALVGSRLSLLSVLRLLIAAMAVILAVLASFGPIVLFFSVSTTSYPFMQLLNVVIFSIAGFLGLKFLLLTLHRLDIVQREAFSPPPAAPAASSGPEFDLGLSDAAATGSEPSGALDRMEGQVFTANVMTVFRLWVIVFGLVGAQMGWVLRPFIGYPGAPFEWFRNRESNFFEAVMNALSNLVS